MSLPRSVIPVLFAGGLDTKSAKQLAVPGRFLVLENCVRRKLGRIEKRFGFSALSRDVVGGSSIESGIRLGLLDDDLVLMNSEKIYSHSPANDNWIDKGAISSVNIQSTPAIRNSLVQGMADIAYTNGITAVVWEVDVAGVTQVHCSIFDETSGSSLVYDHTLNVAASRPKVVGINGQIIMVYLVGNALKYTRVSASDPTQFFLEGSLVGSGVAAALPFDICPITVKAALTYVTTGGQIKVAQFNSEGAVGSGTNGMPSAITFGSATDFDALTCINIVADAVLDTIMVTFHASSGTYINKVGVLATDTAFLFQDDDDFETLALVRNVGCASAGDGTYTVFYEVSASQVKNHYVKMGAATYTPILNTLSTGVPAVFARSVGLYSKPTMVGPYVYVTVSHESTLQSTYFIIRDDGLIVGKMSPGVGGGLTRTVNTARTLRSGLSSFDVVGDNRAIVGQITNRLAADLDGTVVAASYGVQRYNVTFDAATMYSDQLGQNLHVGSGIVGAYDGVSLTELGFNIFPEGFSAVSPITFLPADVDTTDDSIAKDTGYTVGKVIRLTTTGGLPAPLAAATDYYVIPVFNGPFKLATSLVNAQAGTAINITTQGTGVHTIVDPSSALSSGTYRYTAVYEWIDAQGQIHQSAAGIKAQIVVAANGYIAVTVPTLRLTQKTGDRADCKIVVYRSLAGGVEVLYRDNDVTNDPTVDTLTISLTQSDAVLATKAVLYTTGGVLDNIAPPSGSIVLKHKNRLFLAGLEDPNQIAYSKEFVSGEGVAFSDAFIIQVDPRGGPITALGVLDDKLIIFKEDRIFTLSGDGPLDTGQQTDYFAPYLVASDTGCRQPESIAITPTGTMFKSDKGIYLLDRSLSVTYVGAPVENFNSLTVTSAAILADNNEVRFTTSTGQALVYNYFFDQWSTFTNYEAVSAINVFGVYHHLKSDGSVRAESTGYLDAGRKIKMAIETSWLAFAQLQGYQRVYRYAFLGDFVSDHITRVKLAYDYEEAFTETVYFNVDEGLDLSYYGDDPTYGDSTVYGGSGSGVYQFSSKPRKQKCESMKFRIEDLDNQVLEGGGSFNLVGLTLEVGLKSTINKMRGSKRIGSL
jgi:hypothetical protein